MDKRVHKKPLGHIVKQPRATQSAAKKTATVYREKRKSEFPADEEIARALRDSRVGDDW